MAFGQEQNTYDINEPGRWKDPQSKAELTVTMYAAADALARMGWERLGDVDPEQIKDPYAEASKAENAAEVAKGSK